ncbi:site-specific DNA-methyltransferase [bacterium]|nr:site-specific DNA-methyltransferase [bacterium]
MPRHDPNLTILAPKKSLEISRTFSLDATVSLYLGDCRDFLRQIPDRSIQLVVTSPPYNIGKSYESKLVLDDYVRVQAEVIDECFRALKDGGSICWEVGNWVENGEIVPLDILLYDCFARHGLKLRNRIVWHFGHGLHCSKRFSGRYEVILWFTKGDKYVFNVDAVRVPQKYPGKKHFKGPNAGRYSCNPSGKNPSDVWDIPNVKSNHVEKTEHPCQFPVALVQRLVRSMTNVGDLVLDPFMGVGSSIAAAVIEGRRGAGAETVEKYFDIAVQRVGLAYQGRLKIRPERPVYEPTGNLSIAKSPFETLSPS